MSPRALVVVADDLTGAADAAAGYGQWADVVVLLTTDGEVLPAAEVVAVDTDSRHGSVEHSITAVTAAVRQAVRAGASVYKKIDSTLRGHIGAEVEAALRVLTEALDGAGDEPATALLAPAFPATGRTVLDGLLHVDGVPRRTGPAGGDLRVLFDGTGLRTAVIGLDVVRRGTEAVVAAYIELRAVGTNVICCDAETDADLTVLWAAAETLGPRVLPVGSAGLTRVAAQEWASRTGRPRRDPSAVAAARADAPVLTVLGSYSALAREQYQVMTSAPDVRPTVLAEPFGVAEQHRAAETLRASLRDGGADALLVPDPTSQVRPERAIEVATALAAVGRDVVVEEHQRLAGLVLTGGETARAVLLAAGVTALNVLGEVEPGVVLSQAPTLAGLPVVTKAGAFGDAGTLTRAGHALHGRSLDGLAVR